MVEFDQNMLAVFILRLLKMTKSCRQEFVESVKNAETKDLVRRYVKLKRIIQKYDSGEWSGKYGNWMIKCWHANFMKDEIKSRIRLTRADNVV